MENFILLQTHLIKSITKIIVINLIKQINIYLFFNFILIMNFVLFKYLTIKLVQDKIVYLIGTNFELWVAPTPGLP